MSTAANNRNSVPSSQPQLMSNVAGTFQYGTLIKQDWGLIAFKRNRSTGAITTYDLSGDATATAGMNLPINSIDGHWVAACLVDDQERMWIAGNSHATALRMIRSAPGDITSWTDMTTSYPPAGWPTSSPGVSATGKNAHTYHHFDRITNPHTGLVDSLWFVDQNELTSPGEGSLGRDILGFRLPNGSSSWSPLVGQGEFQTTEQTEDGVNPVRSYCIGIFVEHRPAGDRLHVWGNWRIYTGYTGSEVGAPGPSQMKPYYVYTDDYTDSSAWKRVDGTSQSMPLTWTSSGADTNSGATISSWNATGMTFFESTGNNVTIDGNGYPHVVIEYEASSTWEHNYWNGSAWVSEVTPNGGTAGSGANPFWIHNDGYMLALGGAPGRVVMHNNWGRTGSAVFRMGGTIAGATLVGDPIQRSNGILEIIVADNETPLVWTFGAHAMMKAA